MILDTTYDELDSDDRISRREPLNGPGPSDPPDTGTPVSATVGVTEGTVASVSAGPGRVTPTAGDLDGIGAGSLFKPVGLIPDAEPSTKGELNDARCVCEYDVGLLPEPNSRIGTGTGKGTGEGSRLEDST